MAFFLVLLAVSVSQIFACSDMNCQVVPFPVRVIKEVPITHGKAGASSSWPAGAWSNPESAFLQNIKEAWASGKYPNEVRVPAPHLIWYDFPEGKAFVPAEVSFRPRQDVAQGWQHAPTKWQFVGTNDVTCDQNSAWAILCEDLSGAGYKTNNDIKFCSVPLHFNRKYRCLGIRILQNTNVWETGLQSLRFWEKVES